MLYLAEVHKKTGFMGAKTELKLLARQQSEQNWSTLSGEEMVPVEIANEYNAGVLVLVDLDNNQQVKKVQDANRHLVGILKTFSRMREKFRSQEEEIEGWKQSLIYQSQELTRREVDIEARSEELQQLEAESHKIEDQRQEFEESRSQILQLKEDIERDRAQLEEAWGLLHSAQQQHDQDTRATSLSDDQVHRLEDLISRLEGTLNQGGIQESLQALRDRSNEQQSVLQQFWNQFDQERGQADSNYSDLEQQSRILDQSWQTWHQDQAALYQLQSQLILQQETLAFKQNHQQWLLQQLQNQGDLEKELQCIRDGITGDLQVDLVALKDMPLNELEEIVDRLQKELGKLSHFVSDQEEELKLQSQTIEELQAKINQASEYDRLNLASDLDDENQNYRLLEETLQGQRQTLRDRNSILKLHQNILNQRKGITANKGDDFGQQVTPLIEKVSLQRQSLQAVLQTLEQDISALQTTIQQTQAQVELSTDTLAQTRTNLDNQAKQLNQRLMEVGQMSGRVNGLQQTLQPLQDGLNGLHQALESVWTPLEMAASEQQQVVNELKHTVISLSQIPETSV